MGDFQTKWDLKRNIIEVQKNNIIECAYVRGGKSMHFLKKASIEDILQQSEQKKQFRTEIDVTSHYKEFELFLSHDMLARQCDNDKDYYEKEKEYLNSKIQEIAEAIQKRLIKNNAAISAIHVPESFFKTSGDIDCKKEFSSNYLSLCEAILNDKSYKVLRFCIKLADEINIRQYSGDMGKKNPVIVIVHAGCMKGCISKENGCKCIRDVDMVHIKDCFIKKLNKITIKTKVKIAVENITPYYDESKVKTGENCGWKCGEEQKWINQFLNEMNVQIGYIDKTGENTNKKKEEKISFGLCIDFCHIFASYILEKNPLDKDIERKNRELCEAMDTYFSIFRETEQQGNIYLFHVSQYGENGEHGSLF